jgi:hypothetical protein
MASDNDRHWVPKVEPINDDKISLTREFDTVVLEAHGVHIEVTGNGGVKIRPVIPNL